MALWEKTIWCPHPVLALFSLFQFLYGQVPNIEPIYQKSLKLPAMLVYNASKEMLAMLLAQRREKAWKQ
jgi:hypothetical protein